MTADPVLAAWAETVNAARDGDHARIAAAEARWEAVTRDLPPTTHVDDRAAEDWAELVEDRRREWDDTAYEPPMTGAIYRHRHERRDIA